MAGDHSKPLGGRAYGSIPHLPGSRTGPADRHVSAEHADLCTGEPRPGYEVIVQEKLDGSCVAVARIGDDVVALGREGRLARSSRNEGRQLWASWVDRGSDRFRAVLRPGERLVGEWLALAHGTRYQLPHEPFVCFDLMRGDERAVFDEMVDRVAAAQLVTPGVVHRGAPICADDALARLGSGFHGAIDPVEGAVWRVEKDGRDVVLVAKHVRPDKVDGALLPENSGKPAIWNWRPGSTKNGSPP